MKAFFVSGLSDLFVCNVGAFMLGVLHVQFFSRRAVRFIMDIQMIGRVCLRAI